MTWKEDGTLLDAYAGLYNTQTGAGTRRDKALNFQVNSEALTISREECEVLFKTSGLVQKIVALLPEDSPIEWYSINLGADRIAPQDISNYLEDKLKLHEKLVEASVLSRLHGNSYILIFANDGKGSDQPINENNLDEIVDLKVLSSYEMRPSVYGSMTGGTAIGSLIEPEYYDLIGVTELNKRLSKEEQIPMSQWRVHRSRVLSFSGRKLYNWMLYKNQGYDLSVLQSVVIAFSSYMQGVLASSGMIQDYSVFTYKLKGLAELILKGQSDAIIKRFLAIQMGMSYNKGLAMDADTEEASYIQRQYGGVGDICDRLKTLLTAETGIPHTKLWGESAGRGSNGGQTEKADYADALESFQRHNWLKPTRELIRLTMVSKKGVTKGKIPEGWKIKTRSSLRLDLEEEANLRQKQARTDQIYRLLGVLHPLEIRKNRFGSPDYSMDTVLEPDIDKFLWKHKDDAEFTLPVLTSKLTTWSSDQNQAQSSGTGESMGVAHTGTDLGTKMGQAAIAGTGGDGGNNAQLLAEESDRDRMSENRRLDGATVKRRFKWKDSTLAIEHLPGDIRHGKPMKGVYGYIQKHTGHDNEPLDFYGTPEFYQALDNGEQPDSKIFEIYQLQGNADDPVDRKSLDETKIVLGAADKAGAVQTYLNHMPEHFLGGINELSPSELRQYRYRRDSYREDIFNRGEPRDAHGRWTSGGGSHAIGHGEVETSEGKKFILTPGENWGLSLSPQVNTARLHELTEANHELRSRIEIAKHNGNQFVHLPVGHGLQGEHLIAAQDQYIKNYKYHTVEDPHDPNATHYEDSEGERLATVRKQEDGLYHIEAEHLSGVRRVFTAGSQAEADHIADTLIDNYSKRHVLKVAQAQKLLEERDRRLEHFSKQIESEITKTEKQAEKEILQGTQIEPESHSRTTAEPQHHSNAETSSSTAVVEVNKRPKRLPSERKVVDHSSLEVTPEGRVEIWRNSEEKKFHETFKFKINKKFEYKVTHEGKELILNKHHNAIELHRERVNGVPTYYPNLREMPNEKLFGGLAKTMSLVEDKGNQPAVPDWKPRYHGSVDKSLVRSVRGIGDYGQMQIHHVQQWSKGRFDEITKAEQAGSITKEEAKNKMKDLLQVDPAKKRIGYSIKLDHKQDREMVILADVVHSINSPLYEVNHPRGIHPDTGKLEKFGIPENGDGGREWFNKTFRPDFWREYYRRYSFVAANEINRRIKSGILSPEQAKTMWSEAHKKATDYANHIKELRKTYGQ